MFKKFATILAVMVVAGSLAVFWHAASMERPMEEMNDMSAPCLVLCVTGGEMGITVSDLGLMSVFAFFVIVFFYVFIFSGLSGKSIFYGFFQKDRHRYLMKTMVMLR